MIKGLKNNVEINGLYGEINSNEGQGRFDVLLTDGSVKRIKPSNLEIVWREETEFCPRGFDKLEEVKRKERAWFRKVGDGA